MSRILYFPISIVILAAIAYLIQANITLNGDVGSLLFDTKLFLAGGTYVQDFFETNPPMIFIIYSPASLFAELTAIPITPVIRIYIILLAIVSFTCCAILLKQIIKKQQLTLRQALLYTLLFIFLYLPVYDFGQREHMLLILMFPYLFAAVIAIENKRINPFFSLLIGLMAALGFGLKPYFLPTLVFIELFIMLAKRQLFASFRIETMTCAIALVFYFIFIAKFHPNYINIMLPLITDLYHIGIKQSWLTIFSQLQVIFCFMMLGYYLFFYDQEYHATLSRVLALSLAGMIAAFLITRTAWSYHVLPAFAIATVLIPLSIFSFFSEKAIDALIDKKEVLFITVAAFIVPFYIFTTELQRAVLLKKISHKSELVNYVREHSEEHTIYCFSSHTTGYCFPLVYMTQHEFVGRFPFFWWLRGLIQLEKNANSLPDDLKEEKAYLIDALADDLNYYQPNLVTINITNEKRLIADDFDYIEYFSQNDHFRQAWKQYHFVKQMGGFLVYKRDSNHD